jgi:glycosyltransferase involved in cell wall biosynthesis
MKFNEQMVSVVLPVFNAAKYLPQCLESLKLQSYPNIEIIAIDDKSSDASVAVLKTYQKQLKNLYIFRNKKRYGLAICHNRALKYAHGKFVTFMNPNDINNPHRFKRQINILLNNPKTVAVGTQFTKIDENNKKIEKSKLPEEHEAIYSNILQTSIKPETVMINRALLPKDLLYFKSLKYPFVFTEVFMKIFQYGNVVNIAHSLYMHREGVNRHGRRYAQTGMKKITSMFKLWFLSKSHNDNRPPLRSLFQPLVKGI